MALEKSTIAVGEPPAPTLVSPRHRDTLADEIRGLSLLGIVLVHAPQFAHALTGYTDASMVGVADHAIAFAVALFAHCKFYLLFSLLFGYSLSYVWRDRTGAPMLAPTQTQRRSFQTRLAGLGLLGLAHGVLFFSGDILLLYALIGCAMLPLVARSNRTVLMVCVASAVLWMGIHLLAAWSGAASESVAGESGSQQFTAHLQKVDIALATASFWQAVHARLPVWVVTQLAGFVAQGFAIYSMFCLGLLVGRKQWLRNPQQQLRAWRRALVWGLLIGLPGALFYALGTAGPGVSFDRGGEGDSVATAVGFLTAPALSLAYVAGVALIGVRWPGCMRLFRPAGRMSLTVYLAESVVMACLFLGFGAGLRGQLGAAAATGMAAGVWLVLSGLAHLWLQHFRRGPMEALLHR